MFEIFLPGSVQVRLNCVETALAQEVSEAALMTQAQRDAFLASYDHAPYENVAYSEQAPGVAARGLGRGGGRHCCRVFVACQRPPRGALYCLSASGVDAGADALAEQTSKCLARFLSWGTA